MSEINSYFFYFEQRLTIHTGIATPPTAAKALVAVAGTLAHVDSLGSAAIAPDTPLARKRQNVNFADATITTTINTLNGNTLGPSSQRDSLSLLIHFSKLIYDL